MADEKTPLKVGYILRKFPVLSETFILNEILALEARGVKVYIFSLTRPSLPRFHEDLPKLKATILYIPEITEAGTLLKYCKRAAKRFNKGYVRTLAYVLSSGNPGLLWRFLQSGFVSEKVAHLGINHLHAHFATRATTIALLASKTSGIPYSFTAHAFDIFREEYSRKALRRKIENARFLITVSEFNKSYLQALTPKKSASIFRVYNGIDLSRYTPNGSISKMPLKILCVARLVEKKGHVDLIHACAHLRDRNIPFACWIVGSGHLRKDLDKLVCQLELRAQVVLLGAHTQMEVVERYREANVFVLPCKVDSEGNRDGLPVSIVEALACGLPVVTTPVTGIPEVIEHGKNGLLTPENDAMALADSLESLATNSDLYERLRANARASVASNFDILNTAETLKELFQKQTLEGA